MRDIAYKAMQAKEILTAKLNRDPSYIEIAENIGVKSDEVVIALEAISAPVSLYEPVFNDGGDTIYLMDQVGGSSDSDFVEELSFKEAMKKLSGREKMILSMRFLQGKTQMTVADEIGISQAQVSRLEKCALKKIKDAI